MASEPLFAVVTPVYNGARFLEGAMRAVQAQTYRPLVHCVLDNASTDATPDIIARFKDGPVPVVAARNGKLLSLQQNWNAAVRLIPKEAAFFKILCADDSMAPHAVERIMALARRAPDLVAISGVERWNGIASPSRLPSETDIFDAANVLARVFEDDARIAWVHVAYNAELARARDAFFDEGVFHLDLDACMRVLAQAGGRFGFVHEPIFDTLRHGATWSMTIGRRELPRLWEEVLVTERYGPAVLSNAQYARVRRGRLFVLYRRLLWWAAFNRVLFNRYFKDLRGRGLAPGLLDYAAATLDWPRHLYETRVSRAREPLPWPQDAVRPDRS
jgi:glycosyltransferase involved in cell wall biosynthesis